MGKGSGAGPGVTQGRVGVRGWFRGHVAEWGASLQPAAMLALLPRTPEVGFSQGFLSVLALC